MYGACTGQRDRPAATPSTIGTARRRRSRSPRLRRPRAPVPTPTPPTGRTVAGLTESSVSLQWADAWTNVTGFKIERETGSTGTWSQTKTVGQRIRPTSTGSGSSRRRISRTARNTPLNASIVTCGQKQARASALTRRSWFSDSRVDALLRQQDIACPTRCPCGDDMDASGSGGCPMPPQCDGTTPVEKELAF
jgi:hypothetical protein